MKCKLYYISITNTSTPRTFLVWGATESGNRRTSRYRNQKRLLKRLTRHYGYDISLGEKRRQKIAVNLRNATHIRTQGTHQRSAAIAPFKYGSGHSGG